MRTCMLLVFIALCLPLFAQMGQPEDALQAPAAAPPRFKTVDVYIDAGDNALAAYQVEVKASRGAVKIVGVEGGEGIYAPAPYYDPEAIQGERVIIGALSTLPETELPRGKVFVARIHVIVVAPEDEAFESTLMAGGGPGGARIGAKVVTE